MASSVPVCIASPGSVQSAVFASPSQGLACSCHIEESQFPCILGVAQILRVYSATTALHTIYQRSWYKICLSNQSYPSTRHFFTSDSAEYLHTAVQSLKVAACNIQSLLSSSVLTGSRIIMTVIASQPEAGQVAT